MLRIFITISVFFLPFTQALTINLGFPMKIYEITLIISMFIWFFNSKLILQKDVCLNGFIFSSLMFWLLALFGFLISLLLNPIDEVNFIPRFGYELDGLTKLAHLLFAILSYIVIYEQTKKTPLLVTDAWLLGATASAIYLWYTSISSYYGYQPFYLPGIERHQLIMFGGNQMARSGTFLEGNFAGLFFLLSVSVAIYRNKFILTFFFVMAILATHSTVTLVGLLVYFFVFSLLSNKISFKKRKLVIYFSIVFSVVALLNYEYINYIIKDKFAIDNAGSSLVARLNLSITAFNMFVDNIFFGVGSSHFGYHLREYLAWPDIYDAVDNKGSDKPISNNIYLELLSEYGLIGFVVFISMVLLWYKKLKDTKNSNIVIFTSSGSAMLVVFVAFPTFTVCYIWAFLAIASGVCFQKEYHKKTIYLPEHT